MPATLAAPPEASGPLSGWLVPMRIGSPSASPVVASSGQAAASTTNRPSALVCPPPPPAALPSLLLFPQAATPRSSRPALVSAIVRDVLVIEISPTSGGTQGRTRAGCPGTVEGSCVAAGGRGPATAGAPSGASEVVPPAAGAGSATAAASGGTIRRTRLRSRVSSGTRPPGTT